MTEVEISKILLAVGVITVLANLLGFLFERLRQPRLIGEIIAGIIIGPFVLGKLAPSVFNDFFKMQADSHTAIVFGFIYWLGIIFLMFLAGSQVRDLLTKDNRRSTAFILGIGKPLAFFLVLGMGLLSLIPLEKIMGEKQVEISTLLIVCCAVAVTSIPVISRIFHDLNIMKTKFAGLVLGIAVLEDIALWGVLAIATSYATAADTSAGAMASHIAANLAYLVLGLTILPRILIYVRKQKWNILYRTAPITYAVAVLSLYIGIAGVLEVNLIFAAFLAGFGLVGGAKGSERKFLKDPFAVIEKFSFSVFIPVYFALVGYRLVFDKEFSFVMLISFLVGSSLIAIGAVALSSRLAGFNKSDTFNLALTLNARGGPGIVLASIAYDAKLINAAFYTTLVLTALITSQIAGSWLRYVMSKNKPLLSTEH